MFGRATKTPRHLVLAATPATPDDGASGCVTRVRCHEFRAQSRSGGPGDSRGIIPPKTQQASETGGGAWCSVDRENAGLQPSEQRTLIEHVHPADRPDLPDSLPRLPLTTGDDWEDYGRGPRPLASLGNMSQDNRAARERLAKQRQDEDTQYTHHWTVKGRRYTRRLPS